MYCCIIQNSDYLPARRIYPLEQWNVIDHCAILYQKLKN